MASPVSADAEQNLARGGLFTEVTPAMPARPTDATIRARSVLIDSVKLIGREYAPLAPGGQPRVSRPTIITLNLFDDVVVQVKRTKNYTNASGSLTWIGKVESTPHSIAIFIVRDNAVYGTVELPNIGRFSIRPNPDGTHLIEEIKEDATLSGEDDSLIPDDTSIPDGMRTPASSLFSPQSYTVPSSVVEISNDDGSIIDVYVVYDQDASGGSVAGADAQAYAELFIAYTNQAYENSNINQRVWLVGTVDGYDHTDTDDTSLSLDLDAATFGSLTGMHAKRDEYHADLVMFLTPYTASSCSGLAWVQATNDSLDWNTYGFAAMEACFYGQTVFAHELGHNMGSRHDWYMDSNTSPASIAHGYIDTGNNFRTIMSYGNRCAALGISCPTIPNFANPSINSSGAATGVPSGTSTSCAVYDPSPATECDADNGTNFDTKALTTSRFRTSRLTWTGAVSTDWATAGNWTIEEGAPGGTVAVNRVPRSFDNVYIPNGLVIYPVISGTATARELTIEDGATLDMTAGTLTVGWSWEDNGGFNATGGTVVFSGPIGVAVTSSSAFGDVRIGSGSDTSVVSLEHDLDINGDLEISDGASLVAGSYVINIAGDWQENNFAGFQAGYSTVICDGASQSINKITASVLLNEDFSEGDSKGCGCNTAYLPADWTRESAWYGGELSDDGDAIAAGNGWLHSPALSLISGATYTLNFDFEQYTGSDTLRIYFGASATSSSMTSLIGTISTTGSADFSFSVPSSGTYYIGFHHDGPDWSYMDNVQFAGEMGLSFYDIQIATGTTTFNAATTIDNNLQIDKGATADFSTHAVSVEGTVTNNGSIRQTRTVADSVTTEFAGIKNGAATTDKYFGLEITPGTGSMGTTSVEIKGNQLCAVSGPPASGVNRCYVVTPSSTQTADIKFYYRSTESNGNTVPDVYLETGGSWTVQTTSARGGSGEAVWATGAGLTGYGTFSLTENLPTYAVSYNANEATSGSVPDAQAKIQGIDLILATNSGGLSRLGYTFSGWNTAANGSGTDYAEGSTYNIDASVTLYAKWTALPTYAVSYNGNEATSGSVPDAQAKIQGIDLILATNSSGLSRLGYTFSGWNTAANGSGTDYAEGSTYSTDASVTLYAKWTALPTYAVSYNGNEATSGSVPDTQVKIQGIDLVLATNSGGLSRLGYTFSGWNTAANGSGTDYAEGSTYNIDASVTLYAKWTALPTYAVSYNGNEATSGSVPDAQVKIQGIDLVLATNSGGLSRLGYTFSGWNTAANGSGTDYAEGSTYNTDASVILYAKWTALPTYAVSYNGNGATSGSVPDAQVKIQGIDLILATNSGGLAKTGFYFAGWNTAANGSGTDYAEGATYSTDVPLVLYAKWTIPLTYVVTYDANGATSGTAPGDQTKIQGTDLILATNSGNLEKTDHVFVGWNTAADGSGIDYAEGAAYGADAALTLYAKWSTPDRSGFWNLFLPAILQSGRR